MNKKFPIHWLEEIIDEISERCVPEITLATGKTPSGHIHIGILREILICDSLRRILEKQNKKIKSYLFLDSLDAAKRFPEYVDEAFQKEHIGKPFVLIPCPFKECKCESYAHHFGNELISTFDAFGIKNQIIWTHELYKKKEMQEKIRIALENTEKIKEILRKYILPTLDEKQKEEFVEMQNTWMPVMAICEKCKRIQGRDANGNIIPNRVLSYYKKNNSVVYECSACGFKSEISIYSGNLKLNWRIDWPAKWSIFKTTCEPAGKDHCVKGGAYDTGLELSKEIYKYDGPIKVPYEWLRLGDYDMKTSKGIVFTPKKYLDMADPELFRMLILRTNPMKHISLRIEEIYQYNDYYERMEDIYYTIQKAESEEEKQLVQFLFPLIKKNGIPNKKAERLPLNLLIFLSQIQNILSPEKIYEKAKSIMELKVFENIIPIDEFGFLLERTKKWIEEIKKTLEKEKNEKLKLYILQKISIFSIPEKVDKTILNKLNYQQKEGIKRLKDFLLENEHLNEDLIQNKIFSIANKDLQIPPKKIFEAIYQIILGKNVGPRLGSFLMLLDKEWLVYRLTIEAN